MPQLTTHLAATVISSGLRIKRIPINRGQRYAGIKNEFLFIDFAWL